MFDFDPQPSSRRTNSCFSTFPQKLIFAWKALCQLFQNFGFEVLASQNLKSEIERFGLLRGMIPVKSGRSTTFGVVAAREFLREIQKFSENPGAPLSCRRQDRDARAHIRLRRDDWDRWDIWLPREVLLLPVSGTSPREHLCVERFSATFQSEELPVLQEGTA